MTAPAPQRQQALATAPPGRAPRVTLASISTTPRPQPFRLLIHGVEKWGKTTLAAGAPGAIFICPEEGLPPELAGTPHFPPPDGGEWTWSDIIDAIRALSGTHEYQTLVLDTVDWIEPLIWKDLCARNSWDNIEAPGYGKGYTAALDEWRRLLAELEQLRRAKGMNVILLAHSWIKTFKDPQSDGWDRYELKINNKAAGVLKEWVDAVLFALHEQVAVKEDGRGKKSGRARGVSTGRRMLFTGYTAAFDGGNRYNLPEEIEIPSTGGWALLEGGMKDGPLRRVAMMREAIAQRIAALNQADAEKALAALQRAGDDGAKLQILDEWVTRIVARMEVAAQKGD